MSSEDYFAEILHEKIVHKYLALKHQENYKNRNKIESECYFINFAIFRQPSFIIYGLWSVCLF